MDLMISSIVYKICFQQPDAPPFQAGIGQLDHIINICSYDHTQAGLMRVSRA